MKRMRIPAAILVTAVFLAAGALPAGAQTTTFTYKGAFDVFLDTNANIVALPMLEIQNPAANSSSITVQSVNLAWNPQVSTTTLTTGVRMHSNVQSCVVAPNQVLAPGEGLSINALTAVDQNCIGVCPTTPCSCATWCNVNCVCVCYPGQTLGNCIYFGPTTPDRITFEVVITPSVVEQDEAPSVRATDLMVTLADPPELVAAKGAEVDMDNVQK